MTQEFHFWVYTVKVLQTGVKTKTCTQMFTAVLYTVDKRWKHTQMPIN